MRIYYYDKKGKPIDFLLFARLLEDKTYRRIKEETLPNKKWVSTVWLGSNYQFAEDGPPIIFETMVFPKKGKWSELDCDRYPTLKEALEGHGRMVKKWMKKIKKEKRTP